MAGGGILMAALHLPDPSFQSDITGVVGLALADDCLDGYRDHPSDSSTPDSRGRYSFWMAFCKSMLEVEIRIGRCGLLSAARQHSGVYPG